MNQLDPHNEALMSVRSWCAAMSRTVRDADLDAHMALISPSLHIYGLPSKEVIDFNGYRQRRDFEFRNDKLITLNYVNVRIVTSTQRRITFRAQEELVARDGTLVLLDKKLILEREEDDAWRLVEDKISHWDVKKIDIEALK